MLEAPRGIEPHRTGGDRKRARLGGLDPFVDLEDAVEGRKCFRFDIRPGQPDEGEDDDRNRCGRGRTEREGDARRGPPVGGPGEAASSRRTTSLVVPEREIATMRSYRRPAGISEAGKASVSPAPAASLAAA